MSYVMWMFFTGSCGVWFSKKNIILYFYREHVSVDYSNSINTWYTDFKPDAAQPPLHQRWYWIHVFFTRSRSVGIPCLCHKWQQKTKAKSKWLPMKQYNVTKRCTHSTTFSPPCHPQQSCNHPSFNAQNYRNHHCRHDFSFCPGRRQTSK